MKPLILIICILAVSLSSLCASKSADSANFENLFPLTNLPEHIIFIPNRIPSTPGQLIDYQENVNFEGVHFRKMGSARYLYSPTNKNISFGNDTINIIIY